MDSLHLGHSLLSGRGQAWFERTKLSGVAIGVAGAVIGVGVTGSRGSEKSPSIPQITPAIASGTTSTTNSKISRAPCDLGRNLSFIFALKPLVKMADPPYPVYQT